MFFGKFMNFIKAKKKENREKKSEISLKTTQETQTFSIYGTAAHIAWGE